MSLKVKNITLQLGDGDQEVTALSDVTLQIEPGQFAALLGPSG